MIYLPGEAGTSKQGGKDLDPTKGFFWKLGPKAFALRNRSKADSLETSNSNSKAGSLRYLIPRRYADDVSSIFSKRGPSQKFSAIESILEGDAPKSHFQNPHKPCLEGTRILVLDEIRNWANDGDSRPVFVLIDQAGTGKSTIATTLANEWKEIGRLGGDFYFVEPSIVTANALFISFAQGVAGIMEGSAETMGSISERLRRLIIEPLEAKRARLLDELGSVRLELQQIRAGHNLDDNMSEWSFSNGESEAEPALSKSYHSILDTTAEAIQHLEKLELELATAIHRPPILLIDALDECSTPDGATLLRWILEYVSNKSPCKFFITFRPENDLLLQLVGRENTVCRLANSPLSSEYQPKEDIAIYAKQHLGHVLTDEDLSLFVAQTHGLFSWAITAEKSIILGPEGLTLWKDSNTLYMDSLFLSYRLALDRASKHCGNQELNMLLPILAYSRHPLTL